MKNDSLDGSKLIVQSANTCRVRWSVYSKSPTYFHSNKSIRMDIMYVCMHGAANAAFPMNLITELMDTTMLYVRIDGTLRPKLFSSTSMPDIHREALLLINAKSEAEKLFFTHLQ